MKVIQFLLGNLPSPYPIMRLLCLLIAAWSYNSCFVSAVDCKWGQWEPWGDCHLVVIRKRPEFARWLWRPLATAWSVKEMIMRKRFALGKKSLLTKSEHCWMKMRTWKRTSAHLTTVRRKTK